EGVEGGARQHLGHPQRVEAPLLEPVDEGGEAGPVERAAGPRREADADLHEPLPALAVVAGGRPVPLTSTVRGAAGAGSAGRRAGSVRAWPVGERAASGGTVPGGGRSGPRRARRGPPRRARPAAGAVPTGPMAGRPSWPGRSPRPAAPR